MIAWFKSCIKSAQILLIWLWQYVTHVILIFLYSCDFEYISECEFVNILLMCLWKHFYLYDFAYFTYVTVKTSTIDFPLYYKFKLLDYIIFSNLLLISYSFFLAVNFVPGTTISFRFPIFPFGTIKMHKVHAVQNQFKVFIVFYNLKRKLFIIILSWPRGPLFLTLAVGWLTSLTNDLALQDWFLKKILKWTAECSFQFLDNSKHQEYLRELFD